MSFFRSFLESFLKLQRLKLLFSKFQGPNRYHLLTLKTKTKVQCLQIFYYYEKEIFIRIEYIILMLFKLTKCNTLCHLFRKIPYVM